MANLTEIQPLPPEVLSELDRRREQHGLRMVTEDESGTGHGQLPAGVYGFTYSPCEDNFPLFNRRDVRVYESHKRKDGTVVLLGFLSSSEKETFDKAEATATLHLFAEPKGEATQLVEIPLRRVLKHVEGSQRKGTGLEIQVSGAR